MSSPIKPIDDGGSAFPISGTPWYGENGLPLNPHAGYGWLQDPAAGMSLRDAFAGKAMQSLIIHPGYYESQVSQQGAEFVSNDAYKLADAMLEARKAPEQAFACPPPPVVPLADADALRDGLERLEALGRAHTGSGTVEFPDGCECEHCEAFDRAMDALATFRAKHPTKEGA